MILQDDLGHFDTGFHNPDRLDVSSNVTSLAKDGIILTNHCIRKQSDCRDWWQSFVFSGFFF